MDKIKRKITKKIRQYGEVYCSNCNGFFEYLKLTYWIDNTYKCPGCFKTVELNGIPLKLVRIGKIHSKYKPIIIIILDGLYIAGAQKHCLYLLEIFKDLGFDTITISLEGGGLWVDIFIEKSTSVIISNQMLELTWDTITELYTEKDIQRVRCFSAHLVTPTLWSVKNLPIKYRIHSNLHSEPSEHEVFSEDTLKEIITRCENVIFPSKKTLEVFMNYSVNFSSNKNKLMVLSNVLYKTNLKAEKKIKSNNSINLAVISRIDDDKFSIPLFIKTIKILTKTISKLIVKVAGNGELYEKLEKTIKLEQLSVTVELIGFLMDTSKIYNWATIVFLPSKRESMSYVMLESLSYNLPIVLPNCGYTIHSKSNKYIYPYKLGKASDAAKNIIKAINDHDERSIKGFTNIVDENVCLKQIRECYRIE